MPEEEDKVYFIDAASIDVKERKAFFETIEISGPDARKVRELVGVIQDINAEADRIVNEERNEGRIQTHFEERARRAEITSANGLDRLQRELNHIVYSPGRPQVSFENVGHENYGGPGGIIEQSEVNVNVIPLPQERERARR